MKGFIGRWLVGAVMWALVIGVVGLALLAVVYGISAFVVRIDWRMIKDVITWFVWVQLGWSIGAWFRAKRRKA